MRAITIQQPYAELFIRGAKFVENRTWGVGTVQPDWIALHAGKSKKRLAYQDEDRYPKMTFGGFVAVAWLAAVVDIRSVREFGQKNKGFEWLTTHTHVEGPDCWVFSLVCVLTHPLAYKGQRGLWTVPPPAVRQLRERFDTGRVLRPNECLGTQGQFVMEKQGCLENWQRSSDWCWC